MSKGTVRFRHAVRLVLALYGSALIVRRVSKISDANFSAMILPLRERAAIKIQRMASDSPRSRLTSIGTW